MLCLQKAPPGSPERTRASGQVQRGDCAQAVSTWGSEELVTAEQPDALASLLAEMIRDAGADSINLRLHNRGIEPAAIREQIEAIGREVLPRLRTVWSG